MDALALFNQDEASLNEPISANGHSYHLPSSRDLARATAEPDPRLAAIRLLESCRLEAGAPPEWSEEYLNEVGEKMALADPMAETRLALRCPNCGNQWDETLDIATFLWAEIEARAKRLLREIHTLAAAYGWTEKEILSLSQSRRTFYLNMVEL
jgi:hypothetical protein